jgi:AMP-binding enzyme
MESQPWVGSYPPGVRWDAEIPLMPVQEILEQSARKWPDQPATEFMGCRISYRELESLANRAARGLQQLGVGPGVHVGLYLPNTPHYLIAFFGVLKAGGTVVLLAARSRTGTRAQGRGQRDRYRRDARSRVAVSAHGGAAGQDKVEEADCGDRRRNGGQPRWRERAIACGSPTRRRSERRPAPQLPAIVGKRRPLRAVSDPRSDGIPRRAAIYRRHHGAAERRHAHPRQSCVGRRAVRRDDPRRSARARARQGAHSGGIAPVPHLCVVGEHAARAAARRGTRDAHPLRSRPGHQRHRRQEDHGVPGRPHDVRGGDQSPQGGASRPFVAQMVRVRGSAAAA